MRTIRAVLVLLGLLMAGGSVLAQDAMRHEKASQGAMSHDGKKMGKEAMGHDEKMARDAMAREGKKMTHDAMADREKMGRDAMSHDKMGK